MKTKNLLFLFSLNLLFASAVLAAPQTDFDGDLISDITATKSGTEITWSAIGSNSAVETLGISFGLSTDFLTLAKWLTANVPILGIVRLSSESDDLVWKIYLGATLVGEELFGKGGDLYLSGADFDGNGIADAAVTRFKNDTIVWEIKPNLFIDSGAKIKRFKFGKKVGTKGDRVFYFSPDGLKDYAAIFGPGKKGRPRLSWRALNSSKKFTKYGFAKNLVTGSRPRPFPIQKPDGTDAIAFVTSDASDTTLHCYNSDGTQLVKTSFVGKGSLTVGDFTADQSGEEVAFQTTTRLTIYNPFSQVLATRTPITGTPVDEINVSAVAGAATAVPTATATPTVTATATATRTATATSG